MITPGLALFHVALPPSAGGSAIAAIQLHFMHPEELSGFLVHHAGGDVSPGQCRLRRLLDVDAGVVARLTPNHCLLMPHGSELVTRRLVERLVEVGVFQARHLDCFPEATSHVECRMLEILACAASPLAVDALLRQPGEWQSEDVWPDVAMSERTRILRRLIDPPTVAAIGLANVGKSSLLNALARRNVAVVSPEAGTTRDHVGAKLDLAGLVVHWVDTPGWRPVAGIERRAFEMALDRVAEADLVVLCGDAEHGFADPHLWSTGNKPIIRCGTKADLGVPPGCDVAVSCLRTDGVQPLSEAVREALVPQELISDPGAWMFHPSLHPLRLA